MGVLVQTTATSDTDGYTMLLTSRGECSLLHAWWPGMLMVTQLLSEKVVLYWASNSRALMTSDNRALALIEAGSFTHNAFALLRRPPAESGLFHAVVLCWVTCAAFVLTALHANA